MKAFRNISGQVKEIEVDVSPSGEPLLPTDTTVEPRPEDKEGYYLTVIGRKWEYIPYREQEETLELVKNQRFLQLASYKEWYLNSPIKYDDVLFDADELSRNRILQAYIVFNITKDVPSSWVTYLNDIYQFEGKEDKFINFVLTILQTFSNRHIEMNVYRDKIFKAETIKDLKEMNIPTKPM